MPVVVELIREPAAQDRLDLAKIYVDAPAWLLQPYPDTEAMIAASLADGALLAGRFNDRLLGAARLERHADGWRLSHLCVRKLTRRRGVGRRLLEEAQRLATEAATTLTLVAPPDQLEAQALAARTHLPLVAP